MSAVTGTELIPLAELPSVVEDRFRVHILLKPSAERMWPPASANDVESQRFSTLLEATFLEEVHAFRYVFICYYFKFK
jgi:hypothetical protein